MYQTLSNGYSISNVEQFNMAFELNHTHLNFQVYQSSQRKTSPLVMLWFHVVGTISDSSTIYRQMQEVTEEYHSHLTTFAFYNKGLMTKGTI